jgi:DNA (cytosine-5)-methyltransferase 1
VNVLDLFSGIGGFSLGLERAGMRTVAFCEIDPFCRKVLAQRFPGRVIYGDIRELTAVRLVADHTVNGCRSGWAWGLDTSSERQSKQPLQIDVICGGFPCQDISVAGKGAGIAGERSGLWSEYARIIGEVRPRYVIVENVAALLGRGLGRVLGDLAALGFDAEWHCIPASAVGAPHRRDRVWLVAYPSGNRNRLAPRIFSPGWDFAEHQAWWGTEPDVGRVAHGVSARVDRLRALGNAIVPQIAEIIGRAIMRGEAINGPRDGL